jgi:hypothetical protein
MADLFTERLERPAGVSPLEGQPSERQAKSRARRRPPPAPRPEEDEAPGTEEETPHQLDRMA